MVYVTWCTFYWCCQCTLRIILTSPIRNLYIRSCHCENSLYPYFYCSHIWSTQYDYRNHVRCTQRTRKSNDLYSTLYHLHMCIKTCLDLYCLRKNPYIPVSVSCLPNQLGSDFCIHCDCLFSCKKEKTHECLSQFSGFFFWPSFSLVFTIKLISGGNYK